MSEPLVYSYYQTFEKRIQTFKEWTGVPNARLMSRAGFFWTANDDHVICFACGIRVKNWNYVCDPWQEHFKYKSKCPFLQVGLEDYMKEKKSLMKYESFEERLKSFTVSWPGTQFQDPVQMANAGFYYLGFADYVKCYSCNIKLCSWDPTDLPLEEHVRWKPNCSHVLERIQTEDKRKQNVLHKPVKGSQEIRAISHFKPQITVERKDLEEDSCVSFDDLGQGLSIRTEADDSVELEMETYVLHSPSTSNQPLLHKLQQKTF